MYDLIKDLKSFRKADRMQRNAQARTRDGGGWLSYGHPAPRRNWALSGLLSEGYPSLRLVTQNLEESNIAPSGCRRIAVSVPVAASQIRAAWSVTVTILSL